MHQEIEETEFYHQDFTTATEWEVLVARLEELLAGWRTHPPTPSWLILEEPVEYLEEKFTLIWHRHSEPVVEDDFPTVAQFEHSILVEWFGLQEFAVLVPGREVGGESKVRTLLSALSLVCAVPVFVLIRAPNVYLGNQVIDSLRTGFEVVHLKHGPLYCYYLTGLLDTFKSKVKTPDLASITLSARLTYSLPPPPWFGGESGLVQLPLGLLEGAITSLSLQTLWRGIPEHQVIDSETHSDFQPLQAEMWQLSLEFPLNPLTHLGECLQEWRQLLDSSDTIQETWKEGVEEELIYFLFPDADLQSRYPYGEVGGASGGKSCAVDSLVWRLAVASSSALCSLGGAGAVCSLWREFAQELRYRWERGAAVPGVAGSMPDLRTCLLNQKVQMLNCCIERRNARELQKYASAANSDDEEEFYDASDDVTDRAVARLGKFGAATLLRTGQPMYVPVTQDPVLKTEDQLEEDTDVLLKLGTDSEASELRARIMSASLLSDMESFKAANPGAILEDFIRWYSPRDWVEREENGRKMGELSGRMRVEGNIWAEMWKTAVPMAAYKQKRLFDDTKEAEKVLQFFENLTVGRLTELIVPVVGHVAVHRLTDACQMSRVDLSVVRAAAQRAERMSRDARLQSKLLDALIDDVTRAEVHVTRVQSLLRTFPQSDDRPNLNPDIDRLARGETVEIVGKTRNPIGSRLVSMLQGDRAGFPAPAEREFVLRAVCPRPKPCSAKSAQMLRAILRPDEFRLVGAFSEDTTFY